jgi:hypothetical protein
MTGYAYTASVSITGAICSALNARRKNKMAYHHIHCVTAADAQFFHHKPYFHVTNQEATTGLLYVPFDDVEEFESTGYFDGMAFQFAIGHKRRILLTSPSTTKLHNHPNFHPMSGLCDKTIKIG